MNEIKYGAIIVAAGLSSRMKMFKPMLELSGSTMIRKAIDTLHSAGVKKIVVVTGYNHEALEKHLKNDNVTICYNENFQTTDMFESVKIGIKEIKDKVDFSFLLPADIPLFSQDTVECLMKESLTNNSDTLIPRHDNKRNGHPILLRNSSLTKILSYKGDNGLKGALKDESIKTSYVDVIDIGITLDADYQEDYLLLKEYAKQSTQSNPIDILVDIKFKREKIFFDEELIDILKAIDTTSSISKAAENLNLSYNTINKKIKIAESNFGFNLIESKTGGLNGGESVLTAKSYKLLESYQDFKEKAKILINSYFIKELGDILKEN